MNFLCFIMSFIKKGLLFFCDFYLLWQIFIFYLLSALSRGAEAGRLWVLASLNDVGQAHGLETLRQELLLLF